MSGGYNKLTMSLSSSSTDLHLLRRDLIRSVVVALVLIGMLLAVYYYYTTNFLER